MMRLPWKNKAVFFLLLMPFAAWLRAQDIPEPMFPYRLVNDFAEIFSPAETAALEQKLRAYHDSTSTQIYVVTVNDLGGYPPSDYAFRLGEEWGIGQKGKDNGAVILIKPKVGNSRGQAFIATGYGLEARINDAYAGRIVRNEMIPYFEEEDYFGGVNAGIDAMIARLSGEFTAEQKEEKEGGIPLIALIIFIIVIILFFILPWGGGDEYIDSDGHHTSGMPPLFFPPLWGGNHRGGGFGGLGGGGGFGGFGGGGGGSFGGGGAGGSW